jgi:hypothetical protein
LGSGIGVFGFFVFFFGFLGWPIGYSYDVMIVGDGEKVVLASGELYRKGEGGVGQKGEREGRTSLAESLAPGDTESFSTFLSLFLPRRY